MMDCLFSFIIFFFFKQKTAYEMRISDWSSDVCSSDLLTVGATNVDTGNFEYFDSSRTRIGVEHIMASGALPPAFAPVRIGDKAYWDGGLVSNTPLEHILGEWPRQDTLALQVDLWSARGERPPNMMDVLERAKDRKSVV